MDRRKRHPNPTLWSIHTFGLFREWLDSKGIKHNLRALRHSIREPLFLPLTPTLSPAPDRPGCGRQTCYRWRRRLPIS